MKASRSEGFVRLSRLFVAMGLLSWALHPAQVAHAGPSPGPSMMTNASNASSPAAQHNLGLPTIVEVVGDGTTDDWAAIQAAIDAAVAPATIVIPSRPSGVRISQALRLRDNVTLWSLDWNQPWKCTGDAGGTLGQWPFYGCLMFGSGEANNLGLIPRIAVNDPAVGATVLTLTAPNYATLAPAVGDIVVVGASATFNVGLPYEVQRQGQMVRLIAVNAGASQVTISAPIEVTQTGSAIVKLTNNGLTTRNASDQDTGIPMWASHKAGVIGGSWVTSVADAPFSSSGGCLECTVRIKSFTGGFGLGYLNLWAGAHGEVENEYIKNAPIEMSWLAHGNNFRVGRVEMTGSGAPNWILGAHEGARGNRAEIGTVNLGATTPGMGIDIKRASGNTLRIGTLSGAALTYYPINISSDDYVGSPPDTTDNVVQIERDNVASVTSYVSVTGNYRGSTATVAAGGSGYTNGAVVTQGTVGGACSVPPTWTITVSAGAITAAAVNDPGHCNTPPTNPVSLTGGDGSGGTLTVTYTGSATLNNTVRYGVHHGAITSGGGNAWLMLAVGDGNWVEGWGDNGVAFKDGISPAGSGYRNLRESAGYRVAIGGALSGGTLTGATTLPGSGQLTAGGVLGLGCTPASGPILDVCSSAGTTYSATTLGSGTRLQIFNQSTTDNSSAKLLFTTKNASDATVLMASVGALLSSHAAGAETAGIFFQQRVAGTVQESGRFTTGGLFALGGGESASFPALKRSSTTLQGRLADDSGFGFIQGKLKTDTNYTAGVPTATGYLTLYDAAGTAYKVPACTGC